MKHSVAVFVAGFVFAGLVGCRPGFDVGAEGGAATGEIESPGPNDVIDSAIQVANDEGDTQDKPYLEASRPWINAIAARDFSAAWDQLSSHAQARMTPFQFVQGEDEEVDPKSLEPIPDVSKEKFIEWMGKVEEHYGPIKACEHVYVEETDPKILSGKVEGLDRVSALFAIGNMPEDIPADIRKASVRAEYVCEMTEKHAKYLADAYGIPVEEIMAGKVTDESMQGVLEESAPCVQTKFVLVEEGGALKVGYFEFVPQTMLTD